MGGHLPETIRDPLLPFCVPSIGSKEEDDSRVKATVAEILDFVGIKDKKFTPFWTQAARDIPLMRIRKLIGDVRERVTCGQRGGAKDDRVVNRGAYLLSSSNWKPESFICHGEGEVLCVPDLVDASTRL